MKTRSNLGAIATILFAFSPTEILAFTPCQRPSRLVTPPTRTTRIYSTVQSQGTLQQIAKKLSVELNELVECGGIVFSYVSKPEKDVNVEDVVRACDLVDESGSDADVKEESYLNQLLSLRRKCHEFGRYQLLVKLLRSDYNAYITTAEFLSPNRIPRTELPNVQEVAYKLPIANNVLSDSTPTSSSTSEEDTPLVPDCQLESITYNDSPLDKLLLSIFRNLVTQHTGGITSNTPGIQGLLDQGRTYMTMELPEGVTYQEHTIAQHDMVKNTLSGLMTPYLPPFYRIFMSGIVPNVGSEWDGKQIGPWFYAPWLTSIVTPPFFGFLVGPSRPNRRLDGNRGGLVVEKCKFLQESGCKGLCLHQCKIPAQDFFRDTLGMDLTVRPNFETQECQWSFGEKPLDPEEDESFPTGCLVGCGSRKLMAGRKSEGLCL
ncbi:hypothetical protein ACHAXN_002472 [Cyclotella atomus]